MMQYKIHISMADECGRSRRKAFFVLYQSLLRQIGLKFLIDQNDSIAFRLFQSRVLPLHNQSHSLSYLCMKNHCLENYLKRFIFHAIDLPETVQMVGNGPTAHEKVDSLVRRKNKLSYFAAQRAANKKYAIILKLKKSKIEPIYFCSNRPMRSFPQNVKDY